MTCYSELQQDLIIMIASVHSWMVALLEDGRMCKWLDTDILNIKVIEDIEPVAIMVKSPQYRNPAVLVMTQCYRFLISTSIKDDKQSGFVDITVFVCRALQLSVQELENVVEIYVDDYTIAFRTEKSLGIIYLRRGIKNIDTAPIHSFTFPSPINLSCFGNDGGLVRTNDNKLYVFEKLFGQYMRRIRVIKVMYEVPY